MSQMVKQITRLYDMADLPKIYGSKGGSQKTHTPVEQEDNLISLNKIKVLLAVADGEVDSSFSLKDLYLADVPVQNADNSFNYEGVSAQFRPGTQSQNYIAGLDGASSEFQVSREINNDTPYIISVTNNQLSAIRVKLFWPRLVKQESNGDLNGTTCEYAIDLSVNGGAYTQYTRGVANGKTTTGYDRSIRVNLPAEFSSALVRIRKITPDSTSSTLVNGMQITTYQEVIDAKFRYPLTALVYVEFSSDLFPNGIPTIAIKKKWKLIRVPTNYNPETRQYSGTWDGTFKMAWSNNPAWVLYDLVVSQRYGLDQRELGVEIDKWGLYEAAQFCDQMVPDGKGGLEPRYLCDVVIQQKVEAYQLIRDICSIFRGLTFYDGEKIGIVVDKPRQPSYVFTNDNVVDGLFSRTFSSDKSLYTTANVQFDDEQNNYQQDIEPVFELEATRRFGFNPVDLSAIGCTRRSEANRRGRWLLKTNLRSETISFTTGLEGMIPMVGDVIAVNDQAWSSNYTLNLSGRIVEASGLQVFVPFAIDAEPGDRILINKPDGSPEYRTIASVSQDKLTIELNTAFSFNPQPDTVFAIDKQNLALQQYVVTGIQKANTDGDDSFQYNITAVQYDPNKYDEIDYGVNIDDRPTSIVDPDRILPPENLRVSSYSKVVQGLSVETMVIGYDKVQYAKTYNVQWRKNNGNWINVPETANTEVDIEGIYAGIYDVRVRAVTDQKSVSAWSEIVTVSLTGKIGEPEPLAVITASDDEVFGIRVKWGFGENSADTAYVELQQVPDNGDGTYSPENASLLSLVPYPQYEYWHTTLPAGNVRWYRARAIDRIGNVSQWTEFVRGMASDDVTAIIGEIKVDIEDSDGYKYLLQNAINSNTDIQNQAEAIIENALANDIDVRIMTRENGARKAEYRQAVNLIADETQARVEALTQLKAQIDDEIVGQITTIETALATETEARATADTALSARLGENEAALNEKLDTYATAEGVGVQYGVKLGLKYQGMEYGAGMSMELVGSGGNVRSQFIFDANRFAISNGISQGSGQWSLPFVVENNQVFIQSAVIQDGSITNAKIGNAIQSNNFVANNTGWRLDKAGTFENNGFTAGEGRMKQTNQTISVADANGRLRVQIGRLTGTF
ncbi:tail protein [Escherichia phage Phagiculus]